MEVGQVRADVSSLGTAVSVQQAKATTAVASASQQLATARSDFDTVKEGLSATNETLAQAQAQLADLQQQADAAAASAQVTEQAKAQSALSHACMQAVVVIMGTVFDAEDPTAAMPTAASQLRQIEPQCAAQ